MKPVIYGWKRREISNEIKNERKKLNGTLRVNIPGIVPNSTLTELHLNQQYLSSNLFKEMLFDFYLKSWFVFSLKIKFKL